MKSFLFLLGILLCSSLPFASSTIADVGSHDFLDEFGLPNDGFGWDTEAFFPPTDETPEPEEQPNEPPVEETPGEIGGGNEEEQPFPGEEENHFPGGEEEQPFPGEEEQPFPGEEEQPFPGEEEQPFPGEEEQPFPGEEEQPFPGEEEQPFPGEEEQPFPGEEEQPFPGEEEQPFPPEEEEPVDPEDPEFPEDPLRDNLLEFGAELIVEQARLDHNISKFNYTTKLTGTSDVSDSDGALYRLSCNITHQNKSLVISANFNVYYQFGSGRRTFSSFSYTLNTVDVPTDPTNPTDPTDPTDPTTPTTPGYVEMTPAQIYSDAEALHILNFATTWIIEKGYNASKIPVSDYEITQIVSFQRKVQTNGINFYKGNIKLADEKKVQVNVQYTISIRSSTLSKFVYYWYYNVSNIRFLIISDEPIEGLDGEYFDEEHSLVGEYVD